MRRALIEDEGFTNKEVSRVYSRISEALGVEVIWGEGGAQSNKAELLSYRGTHFIRVPTHRYRP